MSKNLILILDQLAILEERISRLEKNAKKSEPPFQQQMRKSEDIESSSTMGAIKERMLDDLKDSSNETKFTDDLANVTVLNDSGQGNFLGFVGASCIFLASVILVKFSIDSGWLTPIRQCILSAIVALMMIAVPLTNLFNDKKYISILPALGVCVLHVTIYGSVFYHQMLSIHVGLLLVSCVGCVSMALLRHFKNDVYAFLAMFGTYLGALILHHAFSHWFYLLSFVLVWALIFSSFAIVLKNRMMLLVSSYLGLGFVALYVSFNEQMVQQKLFVAAIATQVVQFLLLCSAVAIYSLKHREHLSKEEAWKFFPVVVFFYGQVYFYLDSIASHYTLPFVGVFALFMYAIYRWAKNRMKTDVLESGGVVYTMISLMFMHAVYFVWMNAFSQIVFVFVMMLSLWCSKQAFFKHAHYKGPLIIAAVMFFYSYGQVLLGDAESVPGLSAWIVCGSVFTVFLLLGYFYAKISLYTGMALYLAHVQAYLAMYRMNETLGTFAIAPLWIVYAFAALYAGYRKKDHFLAISALPLIIISMLKFLVSDFAKLNVGERVLSLFIMGALIYAGGYFFRKTPKLLK